MLTQQKVREKLIRVAEREKQTYIAKQIGVPKQYKERYVTTILMNLPHLPMSAYRPQDIALHESCWESREKNRLYVEGNSGSNQVNQPDIRELWDISLWYVTMWETSCPKGGW